MKKTILLSLASSLLHAEDNGFFVSAGYQIGEAVQMVKNTGELKNLNEKYEQLSQYLNQVASLKQSIQNANNIELVNSSLNYLKSFTNNTITAPPNRPSLTPCKPLSLRYWVFGVFMRGTTLLFLWVVVTNPLVFRVTLLFKRL